MKSDKQLYDCIYEVKTRYLVKIKAESPEKAKSITQKGDFSPEWIHRLSQEIIEVLSVQPICKIED